MMTPVSLMLVTIVWQLIYMQCCRFVNYCLSLSSVRRFIPESKARSILASQAPSYMLSTLHALYVTKRGFEHLAGLLHAPVVRKMIHPLESEIIPAAHTRFVVESGRVTFTNLILAGYLLTDLWHVIAQYPQLGKMDIIMHHVAFLACAIAAGHYSLHPFTFGWLIIGEASTPFLNTRWFLIKAGKGSTKYFRIIEALFGLVFITTRLFIYSIGLVHHLISIDSVPSRVPTAVVMFTTSCIIAGFALNLAWLRKMYMMLTGRGKHARRSQPQTSAQGTQLASHAANTPGSDVQSELNSCMQTDSSVSEVRAKSE
eukprot:TRINITY_DN47859_c0_g1_i1.p1 TRINITY_DN47859_c0_g1~~TRINITY_DN47859_c0_g1_i1.p1  ORF type:complete len:314 (-),score=30.59 TRINITY_DN47859_c0_g1_i1:917-1858(-)